MLMDKEWIKCCCASCQQKLIDDEGVRICSLMQIQVSKQMKCQKWQGSEGLNQAPLGKGRVKRREYLLYVFEIRMQEQEAIDNGLLSPDDVATLDTLRKRFEAETGRSPFVIR